MSDVLPLEDAANECSLDDEPNILSPDELNLTDNEKKVWQLLAAGFKQREIARLVGYTPQSVSKTKMRLKKKLRTYLNEGLGVV